MERNIMSHRPIETARDPDLRLSVQAMERAALRAREIARQTATDLVISRNGVVECLPPDQLPGETPTVQEPAAPYQAR
jgi:hypothetical protein